MDFFQIKEKLGKNEIEVYPDFLVGRSKDLMVRGKGFYAVWLEDKGLWSTDEYDVQKVVDDELRKYAKDKNLVNYRLRLMSDFSSNSWASFRKYMSNISDNSHQLDSTLSFVGDVIKQNDYISHQLPYKLEKGSTDAFDEIIGTLYGDERDKLEWAIGSVISGASRDIQKFIVIYGEAGGGKSTFLNILQKLFEGYYTTFDARALTTTSNSFSTEVFRTNPLVAIQHDGDLSKIEDNTKLNSIVSHEEMTMNEKYKPSYTARANCFLFIGTNTPVKISDAKSGIIRRLIDVKTSGNKIPPKRYFDLMSQINFELGAIAYKCLEKFKEMGKNYYSNYRPLDMILQTDIFFNFVETNFFLFKETDGVSLQQAYEMYKAYCDESMVGFKLPRHKFREELKNYFEEFSEVKRVDGKQVRSYYSGLKLSKFSSSSAPLKEEKPRWLYMDSEESVFDKIAASYPAQYASDDGYPIKKWGNVKTILSDLDTRKMHYVVLPKNHIVIDFDIKDDSGNKSIEQNLEEAAKWPPTYAEFSKSGAGLHLHYFYDGDPSLLSSLYSIGIEIKTSVVGPKGPTSLRRKLTRCNDYKISTISGGLPLKEKKMINFEAVKTERALRTLIIRNLRKEIHPGTKPSMDFIKKILDDAYSSGLNYDVSDLYQTVLTFAMKSTNNADYCVRLLTQMHFRSESISDNINSYESDDLVFFDTEVLPNLFVVCWKIEGKDNKTVRMINPTPQQIEKLLKTKLVGFNNRRYDNHILYARYLGYDNERLYELSKRIVSGSKMGFFGEAYNLSYADVYDFSSKKQSLKLFQIDLGIHHQELGLPWDQEVPEDMWDKVAEYCENDVVSLESVFHSRKEDFIARTILSELSGLSVNDTTQAHTARIIFGKDPKPQEKFVYTDLSKMFPGYTFSFGKSMYKGEDPGEGGYVYSQPGYYENVVLLDVDSMHPTSIKELDLFGPYTSNFNQLLDARLALKHGNPKEVENALGGILKKYLDNADDIKSLVYALKIIINIVYGLTSAKFENKFKDPRNIDNIVAKRGALFMIDLKEACLEKGFSVVHIKTDSIKIANATKEMIDFVVGFGKKYGYNFKHEATYDKFCLINDAVYIAREKDHWTSVGAQFSHSFVFKTLFSKEPIEFKDLCEVRSVTTSMYLDMNEGLQEGEHDYHFVGKTGLFCPMLSKGGVLYREKDGKYYAVTGTKGFRWMESEMVENLGLQDLIDLSYQRSLVDASKKEISKFVDFEYFIS